MASLAVKPVNSILESGTLDFSLNSFESPSGLKPFSSGLLRTMAEVIIPVIIMTTPATTLVALQPEALTKASSVGTIISPPNPTPADKIASARAFRLENHALVIAVGA